MKTNLYYVIIIFSYTSIDKKNPPVYLNNIAEGYMEKLPILRKVPSIIHRIVVHSKTIYAQLQVRGSSWLSLIVNTHNHSVIEVKTMMMPLPITEYNCSTLYFLSPLKLTSTDAGLKIRNNN